MDFISGERLFYVLVLCSNIVFLEISNFKKLIPGEALLQVSYE